ncbi:3580_t:CDS:2 [Acaulospora colombiana]|uniref:3580_t:CDS:1 n=1 Tax=Acaulospora colombiana TaxID=27376 RepID=A0ACA9M526_9GLOM|nr:3580_t:CDS:2 [Acaulospora colombiana]
MSSTKPPTDLDSNLKLLRTSLNAIYVYTGNMLEARISQGQRNSRQAVSVEPSREDLEHIETFRRQFNELEQSEVKRSIYSTYSQQLAKETFERELQSKGSANDGKTKGEFFTAEETKRYNDKIALLEGFLGIDGSAASENM